MIVIEASILSADYARLGEQAREAEAAGVDGIQIDVMDGQGLNASIKELSKGIVEETLGLKKLGTGGALAVFEEMGSLPLQNWRYVGRWKEGAQKIAGRALVESYVQLFFPVVNNQVRSLDQAVPSQYIFLSALLIVTCTTFMPEPAVSNAIPDIESNSLTNEFSVG